MDSFADTKGKMAMDSFADTKGNMAMDSFADTKGKMAMDSFADTVGKMAIDSFADTEGKMAMDSFADTQEKMARGPLTYRPAAFVHEEIQGKMEQDLLMYSPRSAARVTVTGIPIVGDQGVAVLPGPLIVGAGPAGLACAAGLAMKFVPYALLERDVCVASMWQRRTYRRLCLHLPKHYCELPIMGFPESYPTYPTKQQFLDYIDEYMNNFSIRPFYRQEVISAEYDGEYWCVRAKHAIASPINGGDEDSMMSSIKHYRSKWLVVATGENAEPVIPEIEGIHNFKGQVMHSSDYRSGEPFQGKKVLVVGCGNSGMEVSLDLANHNVHTSMVVRDSAHFLPREIMGLSTFTLSLWLLKYLRVQLVDRIILLLTWFMFGNTKRLGIPRPSMGPMELKQCTGKTPVLDVGTIGKIKSGDIKVFPGIQSFQEDHVKFIDGRIETFDVVILATGYKSNVPYWLKENGFFSQNGFPQKKNEWKAENGLYAIGFSRRGLLGVSIEAAKIVEDIVQSYRNM